MSRPIASFLIALAVMVATGVAARLLTADLAWNSEAAAAWAQFWAAAFAVVAAIVISRSELHAQRKVAAEQERRRTDTYLTAAIEAGTFAAHGLDEVANALGKMRQVSVLDARMYDGGSILHASETTLSAFPLHQAPTANTARAFSDLLRQVRHVRGRLDAFVSAPEIVAAQMDFSQQAQWAWEAVELLKSEQRRLLANEPAS